MNGRDLDGDAPGAQTPLATKLGEKWRLKVEDKAGLSMN